MGGFNASGIGGGELWEVRLEVAEFAKKCCCLFHSGFFNQLVMVSTIK